MNKIKIGMHKIYSEVGINFDDIYDYDISKVDIENIRKVFEFDGLLKTKYDSINNK